MTEDANILADNFSPKQIWHEQDMVGWVRWLRAGGRLGEWTDHIASDVEFACQVLSVDEGDSILNVGCGWGRHAITLAHYGLNVIGIDSSPELLELGRETAEQFHLPVTWALGDLDELVLDKPLDAVVQFDGNLLEWVDGPADALFLLDQVHAILKNDGLFLFGSSRWQETPPAQEQSTAETPQASEIQRRIFDSASRTLRSQTVIQGRDGSHQEYWRSAWYPTAEQMAALLYQAEFGIVGRFNDFSFLPYDPARPGLIWLVRKE